MVYTYEVICHLSRLQVVLGHGPRSNVDGHFHAPRRPTIQHALFRMSIQINWLDRLPGFAPWDPWLRCVASLVGGHGPEKKSALASDSCYTAFIG